MQIRLSYFTNEGAVGMPDERFTINSLKIVTVSLGINQTRTFMIFQKLVRDHALRGGAINTHDVMIILGKESKC